MPITHPSHKTASPSGADTPPAPRRHILTAALLSLAAATSAAATDEPGTTARAALPSVTVSASKREQARDSINGTALVVGREAIDDAQVLNAFDLERVLPGVQMSGSGSLLFPLIAVRGVSSAQDFYNPALTVYIDGVPQPSVIAAQALLDVERVELLKGPQGTLYGKSASGGILNIVSRKPGEEPRRRLRVGVANGGGYLAHGEAAGALVKNLLYGAVALMANAAPGDLRNRATGANHQGGARTEAGSVKLRLAPSGDAWEAGLSATRDCATASQDAYVPFDDLRAADAFLQSGMPAVLSDFHQRRCGDSAALAARRDFGGWRLNAIAAWQRVEIDRAYPVGPYHTSQPETWRQNVQELRLSTHGARRHWDGVAGLYRQAAAQSRDYVNDLQVPATVNVLNTGSRNHSEALAAYGDLTWHATPAWDLSAGLRMSRDRSETRFAGTSFDFASMLPVAFADAASTSGNTGLGKLSAGYRLDAGWRVYANLAQGYKPGGFNLAPSSMADAAAYGRERSISREVGARLERNALRADIALYRVTSVDTQMYGGDDAGYQTLRNVGDTRSTGIEAALELELGRHWSVAASGYLNRAGFRRYDDPAYCPDCGGNNLPFAPSKGATLRLRGDIGTRAGRLRPELGLRYVGPHYFDAANTLRQSGYALVDATLAWRAHPRVELLLYGRNLGDRAYRTYGFSYGALGNFAQVVRGRTLGQNATMDF